MRKPYVVCVFLLFLSVGFISFRNNNQSAYVVNYHHDIAAFKDGQSRLLALIQHSKTDNKEDITRIRTELERSRNLLKTVDFWLRYLGPLAYKKINGPLPVEWETEVFEKFEKPYQREGAGLTLATLYLDEEHVNMDTLSRLVNASLEATNTFTDDSITTELDNYHHFYLANRLYLLDLAAIYTTGFECPDPERIIPELKTLLTSVNDIYRSFNESYPATPLSKEYLDLYERMMTFVNTQPEDQERFDHFTFIKDYVNPLFTLGQQLTIQYKVVSHNMLDYSLNKTATSIFDKSLYAGQNSKGIFLRVTDENELAKIEELGKLLFYDPILSGNNMRSCASCHKPTQFFTDTTLSTSPHFNNKEFLPRNTPSLVNSVYNHLVMLDGKHYNLQNQTKAVISNPIEMGCDENEVVRKVLSCNEYYAGFKKLLKHTPQEKEIGYDHIVSAITYYYSKFSSYYAPFDKAMNNGRQLEADAREGFDLFMSKAQCATCHFAPQFNGVKPPYIGSEFEVLGVPADTGYKRLSPDEGRYLVNPAKETRNAFRTGSLRNAQHTKPYMHNGVFTSMRQVVDFYDAGGGAGRGLSVNNQTLSSDSLKLTEREKDKLIAFITSLNEEIVFDEAPASLPRSKNKELNKRKVGGEY